jgi:hypothetical protein
MQVSTSTAGAITPKNVIGISVLLLFLAVVFGVLNGQKAKSLQTNLTAADAARNKAEQNRMAAEKEAKAKAAAAAEANTKAAEAEVRATAIQNELTQLQTEKNDLQTKLQANQAEVASLTRRIEEAGGSTAPHSDNPGAASPAEMQAQLDEARRQLESAERENTFLSDKIRVAQEQAARIEEERKRRREASSSRPGIRGTILAVNQAYNFVVLNLGGRQGVEPNSEMLVIRDGTVIGKIRISSVEPSSAIGDIVTSSLERGVQVQPGDVVVYAGVNS